jgi:hypothetical protein
MRLSIEVPSGDLEIINRLTQLPGARLIKEERLDGAEIVRVILEIAAAAGGVAGIAHSAASTAKSAASIATSLRQIFRDGSKKYRTDPNRRLVAYLDKKKILSSDMTEQEIDDENLDALDQGDDRST